ncbi:MAG: hypothetical protein Q8T13_12740 [Acidobacteriota bacterium]|nr:hypothetical protein [Acidobacteriota bacterium]
MLSRRHVVQVGAIALLSALALPCRMLAAQPPNTAVVTLTIEGMT